MSITQDIKDLLLRKAEEVTANAYSPYSKFRVGAAILTEEGGIYAGCNVENISYGLTVCGERNAVFQAVAHEGAAMKIKAIALATVPSIAASPCGACRQVLLEFSTSQSDIYFKGEEGLISMKVRDLLPLGFVDFKGEACEHAA